MDLTKGMFGDVSPSYLSPDFVMRLNHCLVNNTHIILNSNNYILFLNDDKKKTNGTTTSMYLSLYLGSG